MSGKDWQTQHAAILYRTNLNVNTSRPCDRQAIALQARLLPQTSAS